ncbi:hypothetical protein [Rhodopseudomonas telluris]|uniref:Uncharacterized protein n=1 Tax=Rhodopseudomonas telluris TaxID=644215 RepID=A0ABV6EWN1_9BRAD
MSVTRGYSADSSATFSELIANIAAEVQGDVLNQLAVPRLIVTSATLSPVFPEALFSDQNYALVKIFAVRQIAPDPIYHPLNEKISALYSTVIANAKLCDIPFTKQETDRLRVLAKLLYVVDKQGKPRIPLTPSPGFRKYLTILEEVRSLFKELESSATLDSKSGAYLKSIKRRKQLLARLNRLLDGEKGKEIIAQYEQLTSEYDALKMRESSERALGLRNLYDSHVLQWENSGESMLSIGRRDWGSSLPWKPRSYIDSARNLNVTFEYALIPFNRPWLSLPFLLQPCYDWDKDALSRIRQSVVASGTGFGNGMIERLPFGLLVVRNVRVNLSSILIAPTAIGVTSVVLPKQPIALRPSVSSENN